MRKALGLKCWRRKSEKEYNKIKLQDKLVLEKEAAGQFANDVTLQIPSIAPADDDEDVKQKL